jgi:uncharacterized protein YndB with AHSA1/START domain
MIGHEVSASAARVFKPMTDAKTLTQWCGPRRYEMIVDKLEPRTGEVPVGTRPAGIAVRLDGRQAG